MLLRFAGPSLTLASALLLFPVFAADAVEPEPSARIVVAQYYGQQRPSADVDDYSGPGGRQDEAGLSVRVDRLESQLRSLTGQLEQAQFQVRKLQEQLSKFQQDVEFRFQDASHVGRPAPQRRSELEPATIAQSPPLATGVTAGTSGSLASAGMRRGDAFDPASEPNAPGVPRQLGSVSSSATATTPLITRDARSEVPMDQGFDEDRDPHQPMDLMRRGRTGPTSATAPPSGPLVPIAEAPPVMTPSRTVAPAVAAAPPSATAPTGPPRVIPLTPQVPASTVSPAQAPAAQVAALPQTTPKSEYEEAVGLLKQGQYDAAEKEFSDFLAKNPKTPLAASALYNLGETYYLRSRHREAAEQFLKISTSYPASPRAPDAMLRLGQSLNAIGGAKEQACAAFGEVGRKYPNASANVRAAADREAKKNQC
jgi:tol-pal system protein YbgF